MAAPDKSKADARKDDHEKDKPPNVSHADGSIVHGAEDTHNASAPPPPPPAGVQPIAGGQQPPNASMPAHGMPADRTQHDRDHESKK